MDAVDVVDETTNLAIDPEPGDRVLEQGNDAFIVGVHAPDCIYFGATHRKNIRTGLFQTICLHAETIDQGLLIPSVWLLAFDRTLVGVSGIGQGCAR
ncbi:hypothetical protein D3C84_949630 [compost metagenome]